MMRVTSFTCGLFCLAATLTLTVAGNENGPGVGKGVSSDEVSNNNENLIQWMRDFQHKETVRDLVRDWWHAYRLAIDDRMDKETFDAQIQQLWHENAVIQEPGIFRYDGLNELLNGSDQLPSVFDGLVAFGMDKLLLADMRVTLQKDARQRVVGAAVHTYKAVMYEAATQINLNFDEWTFEREPGSGQWKALQLTIELTPLQHCE